LKGICEAVLMVLSIIRVRHLLIAKRVRHEEINTLIVNQKLFRMKNQTKECIRFISTHHHHQL